MMGLGSPITSQSQSLVSLPKQSARGRSQRIYWASWPQKGCVKAWQVSACKAQAHSCRLVAFNLLYQSEAPTERLLYPDAGVLYAYLLNCKPLTNASCRSFNIILHKFFSLSVTVWCSWSISLIAGTNWVIYSTTSVCSAENRIQYIEGRGSCVSLLTFQSHVKH